MKIMNNDDAEQYGGKAHILSILKENFNVPSFFTVCLSDDEAPDDNKKEILSLCDLLSSKHFAIRSSASAEDKKGMSFAGMFSSYIGISKDKVLDAIDKVLKSKNTERANIYASLKGIDLSNVKMNVIIQKYIDPVYSGVCFIQNNRATLEIVQGACDKLVSGECSAMTITAQLKNNDEYILENDTDFEDKALIHQVLNMSIKVRSLLNFESIDMEWAYGTDDVLYVIQARPLG